MNGGTTSGNWEPGGDMAAVGPKEINRIVAVQDEIGVHRDAVRIPLGTEG